MVVVVVVVRVVGVVVIFAVIVRSGATENRSKDSVIIWCELLVVCHDAHFCEGVKMA